MGEDGFLWCGVVSEGEDGLGLCGGGNAVTGEERQDDGAVNGSEAEMNFGVAMDEEANEAIAEGAVAVVED